jgi:hypothetical protein
MGKTTAPARPPRTRSRQRPRDEIKDMIARALRRRFPCDTVDVSDGYRDNIHVLVVSREFDRMAEAEKQAVLWKVIDGTELRPAEKRLISLVYPISPGELK